MPATGAVLRRLRPQAALDDDGVLLRRAANGDDAAFEAFHDRYADALLRYSQHVLGSRHEAEDAVQQTFFNAYRHVAAGNFPSKPRAWLYAIARNQSLSAIRGRREQPAELAEPATQALTEEVERRADLRDLVRDVNRLPEDQRSAIVLFELADLPQAEIADVLGRKPGQVKSLVYQARTTLMARRTARELPCERVQRQLSVSRKGELNSRMLRHHLDGCAECRRYREDLRRHRRRLAAIFPVAPALATAGAKHGAAVGSAAKIHHLKWTSHSAAGAATVGVAAAAVGAAIALSSGGGHPAHHGQTTRPLPSAVADTPASRRVPHQRHRQHARVHKQAQPAPHPAPKPVAPRPRPQRIAASAPPVSPSPSPPRPEPQPPAGSPPQTQSPPPSLPPPPSPPAPPPAEPSPSAPTVVAAPPPPPPVPPPARTDHGHHYGQVKHPGHGNH